MSGITRETTKGGRENTSFKQKAYFLSMFRIASIDSTPTERSRGNALAGAGGGPVFNGGAAEPDCEFQRGTFSVVTIGAADSTWVIAELSSSLRTEGRLAER